MTLQYKAMPVQHIFIAEKDVAHGLSQCLSKKPRIGHFVILEMKGSVVMPSYISYLISENAFPWHFHSVPKKCQPTPDFKYRRLIKTHLDLLEDYPTFIVIYKDWYYFASQNAKFFLSEVAELNVNFVISLNIVLVYVN